MTIPRTRVPAALCLFAALGVAGPASAQSLTSGQRKEVREVQRNLQDVSEQIEAGQTAAAAGRLDTLGKEIDELVARHRWSEKDRTVTSLRRAIDRRREQIREARSAPAAPTDQPAADPAPAAGMKDEGGTGTGMKTGGRTAAMAGRGIPMTGSGTADDVFVRDVAPTFVNACGGCHAGDNPRGGFKLATFSDLMDSGYIEPGDAESSHIYRLMGGLDQPKMPPGNRKIRESDWEKLKAWVDAGAEFSGDPDATLRSLVPTPAQLRAAELAKMGDAEFDAVRAKKAAEQFDLARPRETAATHETARLRLIGNVPVGRLEQLGAWGEQVADELIGYVGEEQGSPFGRGKLTVFVAAERFDYEEVNMALMDGRSVPPTMTGHAVRTVTGESDYAAVQDLRDDPTPTDAGMRANLAAQLAVAALKRGGWEPPGWLGDGFGLAIAAKTDARNVAFRTLRDSKSALAAPLRAVTTPGEIVTGEAFPSSVRPLAGLLMVEHLLANGGERRFSEFVTKLRTSDLPTALGEVYRTTPDRFAADFARSLGR